MFADPRYLTTRLPGYLDLDAENNNLLEKARQHFIWDRLAAFTSQSSSSPHQQPSPALMTSPHQFSNLPNLPNIPNLTNLPNLPSLYGLNGSRGSPTNPSLPIPAHLWSQWTALHGLASANPSPSALAAAAAASHMGAGNPQVSAALALASTSTTSATSASGHITRPLFPSPLNLHRYSPYFLPKSSPQEPSDQQP